jgi:hypothetical protein
MGLILHLIIGGLAGFIAGNIMKGGGYGLLSDVLLGIVGGWVGGWLFGLLGVSASGRWGSFLTALVGACVLIAIARAIKG